MKEVGELAGRVVILTGSTGDRGVEFAQSLAEAGASLVLIARDEERLTRLARTVSRAGSRALAVSCDVTDADQCRRVVRAAIAKFGQIDGLVNNAAVRGFQRTGGARPPARDLLEVSHVGTHLMANECARVMRPGSSIVNVVSLLRPTRAPGPARCGVTAGPVLMTRELSKCWSGDADLRVNALCIDDLTSLRRSGPATAEMVAAMSVWRPGEQSPTSAALHFLLGPASSLLTGLALGVVDPGLDQVARLRVG